MQPEVHQEYKAVIMDDTIDDKVDDTRIQTQGTRTSTFDYNSKDPVHVRTEYKPIAKQKSPSPSPKKRNAFAELMSAKPAKHMKTTTTTTTTTNSNGNGNGNGNSINSSIIPNNLTVPSQMNTGSAANSNHTKFHAHQAHLSPSDARSGLLAYIQRPESFPSSIVIRTTPHTVLIRDLYPKATVHLLLLPRSPQHYNLHPQDALCDASFLEVMRSEAESASQLAAQELRRLISPFSAQDKALNDALDHALSQPVSSPSPPQGEEGEQRQQSDRDQKETDQDLPNGRNYLSEIKVGIHAHPSMSHLHIHIISRDMHSSHYLKHRKHYNSFNTDFFVPLRDFPLTSTDPRLQTRAQNDNIKSDLICWRCSRGFGNKFKMLKDHLETEFEEWKRC